MSFLSRFSYALLSLVLIAAGTVYAFFTPRADVVGLSTLLVAGLLILYWVFARRGALTPVNPAKRVRIGRGKDRPVVVHFYSDFSLSSLVQRPLAAKAERLHKGHCDFIYVEVGHKDAPEAMKALDAGLGDWVLYDAAGNFVEKTRSVSVAKLEQLR
jgi:hypothetical protein